MNEEDEIVFDLHLDQKKPSYVGTKAHGGEYDGPTVEKEMSRIAGWASHITGVPTQAKPEVVEADEPTPEELGQELPPEQPKKNDLFQGIFQ